ncbi:MAG: GGDEF domain-containing protein [Spirochaetaceae bacterium]|jgi:diguanylate cyclase (GGDEF)-like protein|nr:GGDEF domain-containing protein [Spirochaetaceae bacterium]
MEEQEHQVLDHVLKLLRNEAMPDIPDELAEIPALQAIHREIGAIREILDSFSKGVLSLKISGRGTVFACLKTLQSQLKNLMRRMQMAGKGDLSQQTDYPGELTNAFNSMVVKLNGTLCDLRKKEETLLIMTRNLQNEVTLRSSAVEALQESELRFRHLASHDSLTGILNRRSFMEHASRKLQFVTEYDTPRCIAIMDIDHFKNFNDSYGHVNGDEALKHVVAVVSEGLRKYDFLCRYGGEEFVFFLGNANLETGFRVAERLRKALENTPVNIDVGPVQVTASFGVAPLIRSELPAQATDQETIDFIRMVIDRADRALYKAKRSGRNKVVAYEPGFEVQKHQESGAV